MNVRQARYRGLARRGWLVLAGLMMLAARAGAQSPPLLHTRIDVSDRGLVLHGPFFRKAIPMADLQVAAARIVDLDREPDLRPWLKIYGAGLPNYQAGWYRLKGRQTAMVALVRSRPAVYLPTTRGYAVLVSPDDPAAFLDALRQPSVGGRVFRVAGSH